ncbi:MAG: DUF3800 domain-containing protein [Micrococcaceae bacterium]
MPVLKKRLFMFVFIDDSGDPGFKFYKGSSNFLVITCVIFNQREDADETSSKILQLKKQLGISPRQEFKFSQSRESVKSTFLKKISQHNFST